MRDPIVDTRLRVVAFLARPSFSAKRLFIDQQGKLLYSAVACNTSPLHLLLFIFVTYLLLLNVIVLITSLRVFEMLAAY